VQRANCKAEIDAMNGIDRIRLEQPRMGTKEHEGKKAGGESSSMGSGQKLPILQKRMI